MIVNFAERAHNHNWELDPVIRSLLDTDFYKLLMLQFIWKHFPKTRVSFSLLNRSSMRLADMFSPAQIREQMEHVRGLRYRKSELVWLAGNTFYGRRGIFEPGFLEWLERDFRLSNYELTVVDGQFHLNFDGLWTDTTMWELYALSIINELKTRACLKRLTEFGLDILYARAKTRLWGKIERLRNVPDLHIADFGTRRRHSFLWQEYVVEAMADRKETVILAALLKAAGSGPKQVRLAAIGALGRVGDATCLSPLLDDAGEARLRRVLDGIPRRISPDLTERHPQRRVGVRIDASLAQLLEQCDVSWPEAHHPAGEFVVALLLLVHGVRFCHLPGDQGSGQFR